MREPAIVVQSRVIGALILRDVKTRFGANPVNYLLAIAWPLSHLALLLTVLSFVAKVAPYGRSNIQFIATGVLPFILFSYPMRFVMTSVLMNAPLLAFPIVTLFDIIIARLILEVISAFAVILVFAVVLWAAGIEIMPADPGQAAAALLSILMFASALGIINALIIRKVIAWNFVVIMIIIGFYATSGILFIPDSLPEFIRYPLSFNPLLQAVSWFRSSYYAGYGELHLSRTYLMLVTLCLFFLALCLERAARRWLLQN